MQNKSQISKKEGVSLYLAMVILAVLLAISLGLTSLLVAQIKIIRGMEESVLAFYAADTGMERMLKNPVSDANENLPNGSSFFAQIRCNPTYTPCSFGADSACDAPRFCIKSKGIFKNTQRAIGVKY